MELAVLHHSTSVFERIVKEVKSEVPSEESAHAPTVLHSLCKKVIAVYEADHPAEFSDGSVTALLALSGYLGLACVSPADALPGGDALWPGALVLANRNGFPSTVLSCNNYAQLCFERDLAGLGALAPVRLTSVPFFVAACAQLAFTGLPHSIGHVELESPLVEAPVKMRVQFSPNQDFVVLFAIEGGN